MYISWIQIKKKNIPSMDPIMDNNENYVEKILFLDLLALCLQELGWFALEVFHISTQNECKQAPFV